LFSRRTGWDASPNKLSRLLEERRRSGKKLLDLTVGNPTLCGFTYPEKRIYEAISRKEGLVYSPEARGLRSARDAIVALYQARFPSLDTGNIFLTASTSESYSLLFKLLCDPGDTVLFPKPSYPLFDYLAGVNDVGTGYYRLTYDGQWTPDIGSLRDALDRIPPGKLGAVVLVNPHNPTGMYMDRTGYDEVADLAARHQAALIVDEVFMDYPTSPGRQPEPPRHNHPELLTFTLNGLSKMAGLPQMKLGWIVLSGPRKLLSVAGDRLEILCDTFLSVNTPVQAGLPGLLALAPSIGDQIRSRIWNNFSTLMAADREGYGPAGIEVLNTMGGWYATLRLPAGRTDEEFSVGLLENRGVFIYPGYYFDFEKDDLVVVSLLPREEEFVEGIGETGKWLADLS
jgi:aspartate/methionine/tyrosine aminotransferase